MFNISIAAQVLGDLVSKCILKTVNEFGFRMMLFFWSASKQFASIADFNNELDIVGKRNF